MLPLVLLLTRDFHVKITRHSPVQRHCVEIRNRPMRTVAAVEREVQQVSLAEHILPIRVPHVLHINK